MKNIKDSFNKIEISKELEKSILNQTIYAKKDKFRFRRIIYTCVLLMFICGVSLSIVYAEEIGNFISEVKISLAAVGDKTENLHETEFGTIVPKEIPSNAIKVNEGENYYYFSSYKEVEEMLNFKILKVPSSNIEDDIMYDAMINDDGSVAMIYLRTDYATNSEKAIILVTRIIGNKVDRNYPLTPYVFDSGGYKKIIKTYENDKLNTKITIYSYKYNPERFNAMFIYDNVLYQLITIDSSVDEVIKTINELEY